MNTSDPIGVQKQPHFRGTLYKDCDLMLCSPKIYLSQLANVIHFESHLYLQDSVTCKYFSNQIFFSMSVFFKNILVVVSNLFKSFVFEKNGIIFSHALSLFIVLVWILPSNPGRILSKNASQVALSIGKIVD